MIAIGTLGISACGALTQNAPAVSVAASLPLKADADQSGQNKYLFTTLDDSSDPTTQLWGINDAGEIVGSYGDGSGSNPYVGITISPPYDTGAFRKVQLGRDTMVTSLDGRTIGGWYESADGWIWGFTIFDGIMSIYHAHNARDTRILGLGDDSAVGSSAGRENGRRAFTLPLAAGTNKFHELRLPNARESVATAINAKGDMVGYAKLTSGATVGWLLKAGHLAEYAIPNGTSTKAWGIDWDDDVVGEYRDRDGNVHGFVLNQPLKPLHWQKIDEPNASGETIVTSINDRHDMVGFYKDAGGNVNGFVASAEGSGS